MDFIVKGQVVSILPEQRFNGKNGEVVKNMFVVQTNDTQYQKKLAFAVFGSDKWEKFGVVNNTNVEVHFDISCRYWNGKWFTELQAWRVIKEGEAVKITQNTQPADVGGNNINTETSPKEDDEIPF